MRHATRLIVGAAALVHAGSCVPLDPGFLSGPIETRFSFLNFSKQCYATLGIREHSDEEPDAGFTYTALLPPGGASRAEFATLTAAGMPASVDFRLLLYRRVHDDVPIGLDEGEAVDPAPIVAGEVFDVPAGNVQVLETYTIVNWEAPLGVGRVKITQCSNVDQVIRDSGMFGNAEGVWEINGVAAHLADQPPPVLAEMAPITGRMMLADGTAVPGVGLLIRTPYRTRLDCADAANEADTGYGDPIAYTITGDDGFFQIDRPAGVYQLEFFSDEYAFRPGILRVETPLDEITVLAEPL